MSIMASAPVPARNRLIDADTARLTAPAVGRFPVNPPYRPQDAADRARQAWEAFAARNVAKVHEAAATLGVPVGEVYDLALDYIAGQTGWTGGVGRRPGDPYEGVTGKPELCPSWCAGGHDDRAERSHVRPIVDTEARHGDLVNERTEIVAQMQAYESPELPGGIDPTTVWVQLCGPDNAVVSACLDLDAAERIGQALVDAARQARR
ncbi:DUF6907 domain-containing protein [Micromonospora tulbaghiae]|uniref:DUF6907 domain-containing protein n=1 Tax=Micromonospora tulbaghiae TaxID=479978 RepID=UPI003EB6C929